MSERERERTQSDEIEDEEEVMNNESVDENACPECSGRLLTDEEHGEIVCDECGLVVSDEAMDHGPDWRNYDDNRDSKRRVGSPMTNMMHDKGLSTKIDWRNRDGQGKSLSSKQRKKMQRLRTWNERAAAKDSRERNLKQALGEIDRMASALGLPDNIREIAGVIYRRALKEDLLIGRSIEGVATASLYAAARQGNVPRSFDKFATVSRVEELEIKRTYQYISRELGLEIEPAQPLQYIPQFASKLELDDEVEYTARDILEKTEGASFRSGKNPIGLAAAAIYAAGLLCNADLPQHKVEEVTEISVVTIRNRYKELLDKYDESTDRGQLTSN